MLKHLLIKNYALIETLEMHPSGNFNVITGETGAGKSIMLGAVGLLLGNRADTKVLLQQDQKCLVEGEFDIKAYRLKDFFEQEELEYDDLSIIRREINSSGKSRAFINDSPVTLDVLTKLGQRLMDVHSQHENLELGKGLYQLNLVDNYAGNIDLLKNFQFIYKEFKSADRRYKDLVDEANKLRQEADYNKFLLQELEDANLKDLDQQTLEDELSSLENAEEIKSSFHQASQILKYSDFSSVKSLAEAKSLLTQISKLSSKYQGLAERMESLYLELDDLAAEVEQQGETIEFNPHEAELVKERLSKVYHLQKKHHVLTVEELRKIEEELAEKVTTTDQLDEKLNLAKEERDKLYQKVTKSSKELSKSRHQVSSALTNDIEQLLMQLGMPNAKLQINFNTTDFTIHGNDEVTILFSANKGFSPQPIQKVASGGEFSRLIFCIKYILAKKMALPTIVFDEIDTGVSGEISMKLAEMMKEMANNHQVITISHSPQIAAYGASHYFVYKDDLGEMTSSRIRLLKPEERILEIAKMIGGDNPPVAAMDSAKSLLKVS